MVIFEQIIAFIKVHALDYFDDITCQTSEVRFNECMANGSSNDTAGSICWSPVENSIGVVETCLPTMRPLFSSFQKIKAGYSSSHNHHHRLRPPHLREKTDDTPFLDSQSRLRKVSAQARSSTHACVESIPL